MSVPPLVLGILAYVMWGMFPLYFDMLYFASHWEIVTHRVFWSAVFLSPCVLLFGTTRFSVLRTMIVDNRWSLLLSTALIFSNWSFFVYAVSQGRVLETSLGYFLSPLVSIILGVVLFKETLSRRERFAFALAVLGVAIRAWDSSGLPWISCLLALSFSSYGVVHKRSSLPAATSLMLETWILVPISLLVFGYLAATNGGVSFGDDITSSMLLVCAGCAVIPLLLFIFAAKKIAISLLGFLFFITPSISFLLGIFYFQETVTLWSLVSFSCIWIALLLISLGKPRGLNKSTTTQEDA